MNRACKENTESLLRLSLYPFLLTLLLTVTPISQADPQFFTSFDCRLSDGTIADLTNARGINDSGDIVGRYISHGVTHGFLLTDGSCAPIDIPGAQLTIAGGINDNGDIVGQYRDANRTTHGFLLSNGTPTVVDYPGATFTRADGINNKGEIVGSYTDTLNKTHGFLRTGAGAFSSIDFPGATITMVWAINDDGEIVGTWLDSANCAQGFVANNDSTIIFPNAPFTSARSISNKKSEIVGFYNLAACNEANTHGYLLNKHGFSLIDFPLATTTEALSINSSGDVVGFYIADGMTHGFQFGHKLK